MLAGKTVLLLRPPTLKIDDTVRSRVPTLDGDLSDALERRMVSAGLGVVGSAAQAHDWNVRVEGAVGADPTTGWVFSRASLRIEVDGVTVDFAELNPTEPTSRRADPEQVAVLLVNALGQAPRLIAKMKERHVAPPPAVVAPPRPVRPAAAPAETECRRQCRDGESRNALGCCEKS